MTGREIAAEVRGDVNQGLSEIDAGHASGLYGHFNDDMEVVWEDQYYELTREEQIAQAKLAKKMRCVMEGT